MRDWFRRSEARAVMQPLCYRGAGLKALRYWHDSAVLYRDKIVGSAPAFPARMKERITVALLPPEPVPVIPLDGETVADVASARHWRTLPSEGRTDFWIHRLVN